MRERWRPVLGYEGLYVEAEGEYLELREEPLPPGLKGFVVDWGKSTVAWHQRATNEKPIIEITE